jgi:hypothetical protein
MCLEGMQVEKVATHLRVDLNEWKFQKQFKEEFALELFRVFENLSNKPW